MDGPRDHKGNSEVHSMNFPGVLKMSPWSMLCSADPCSHMGQALCSHINPHSYITVPRGRSLW